MAAQVANGLLPPVMTLRCVAFALLCVLFANHPNFHDSHLSLGCFRAVLQIQWAFPPWLQPSLHLSVVWGRDQLAPLIDGSSSMDVHYAYWHIHSRLSHPFAFTSSPCLFTWESQLVEL